MEKDANNSDRYHSFKMQLDAYSNLSAFACPSDGNAKGKGPFMEHQTCSYVLNWGDSVEYCRENVGHLSRGIFGERHRWCKIGDITDGTSNTIAVCETGVFDQAGTRSVKAGGLVVAPANHTHVPQNCLNAAFPTGTTDRTTYSGTVRTQDFATSVYNGYDVPSDASAYRGCSVVWAECINQGFITALPPNGPNCLNGAAATRTEALVTAGSYHAGGVNSAFADGSGHFISETINTDLSATRANNYSAASPYGVWGALGTYNCSESVTGF